MPFRRNEVDHQWQAPRQRQARRLNLAAKCPLARRQRRVERSRSAAGIAALAAPSLGLNGEIATFDQQLRSRIEPRNRRDPEVVATPPIFIAFDVLYRAGKDLSARPLRDRRPVLEDLVSCSSRAPARVQEAWAQVLERGYEGLVAKDEASPPVGETPTSLARGRS